MRLKFKRIKALLTAVALLFSMAAVNVSATPSTSNDFIGRWEWIEPEKKVNRVVFILEFSKPDNVAFIGGWYGSEIASKFEGKYTVENNTLRLTMNETWNISADPYMGNGGELDSSKIYDTTLSVEFLNDKLILTYQSGDKLITADSKEFIKVAGGESNDNPSDYSIIINRNTIKDATDVNGEYYGNLNDIIGAIGDNKCFIDYRNSSAQVNLPELVIKFNFDNEIAGTTMIADVMYQEKQIGGLEGYYNGNDILINPLDLKDFMPHKLFTSTTDSNWLAFAIEDNPNISPDFSLEKANDIRLRDEVFQLIDDEQSPFSRRAWGNLGNNIGAKTDRLSEFIVTVSGLMDIDVHTDIVFLPKGTNDNMNAKYITDDRQVGINRKCFDQSDGGYALLQEYILHELRHAYQLETINMPLKHVVSDETRMHWKNNYSKSGYYNAPKNPSDDNKARYAGQPIEWDAYNFSGNKKIVDYTPQYRGSW